MSSCLELPKFSQHVVIWTVLRELWGNSLMLKTGIVWITQCKLTTGSTRSESGASQSQKKSGNRYDQAWNRSWAESWKPHLTYLNTSIKISTEHQTQPVQAMIQCGLGDIPSSVCQNKLIKWIWDWKISLLKPKRHKKAAFPRHLWRIRLEDLFF